MTKEYVGQKKEKHCNKCEQDTQHYLYHSGEWVCTGECHD